MLIEALISRGLRMLHDRVEEEIISRVTEMQGQQ